MKAFYTAMPGLVGPGLSFQIQLEGKRESEVIGIPPYYSSMLSALEEAVKAHYELDAVELLPSEEQREFEKQEELEK